MKSSDFFNVNVNSYEAFSKELDSLGIEAVLVINLHRFDNYSGVTSTNYLEPFHYERTGPDGRHVVKDGMKLVQGPDVPYEATGAIFKCYLIKSNYYFPVWTARFEVKSAEHRQKQSFRNHVSQGVALVAKELSKGGYIALRPYS